MWLCSWIWARGFACALFGWFGGVVDRGRRLALIVGDFWRIVAHRFRWGLAHLLALVGDGGKGNERKSDPIREGRKRTQAKTPPTPIPKGERIWGCYPTLP